jgi:hypothetical protein
MYESKVRNYHLEFEPNPKHVNMTLNMSPQEFEAVSIVHFTAAPLLIIGFLLDNKSNSVAFYPLA